MTATGHAIVGAAIATQISNPFVALPVAFFSHFVCDKLPHWDVMTDKKKSKSLIVIESGIDVVLSLALVWLIFISFLKFTNPALLFTSAFAAQLPDWLEVPYSIFKIKIPLVYSNYKLQSWIHDIWFDSRMRAPWGIVTQVAVCTVIIFGVAYLRG